MFIRVALSIGGYDCRFDEIFSHLNIFLIVALLTLIMRLERWGLRKKDLHAGTG